MLPVRLHTVYTLTVDDWLPRWPYCLLQTKKWGQSEPQALAKWHSLCDFVNRRALAPGLNLLRIRLTPNGTHFRLCSLVKPEPFQEQLPKGVSSNITRKG